MPFTVTFILILYYHHLTEGNESKTYQPRLVSANTVPSCDPQELGHLLPKEVEFPIDFGLVRAISCGSQHSVLLTTHGSVYTWGRNVSGQMGE